MENKSGETFSLQPFVKFADNVSEILYIVIPPQFSTFRFPAEQSLLTLNLIYEKVYSLSIHFLSFYFARLFTE